MRKPFYKVCHLGHGVFALIKNDKPNRKSYQCMMADIKEKTINEKQPKPILKRRKKQ